jgi:GNAT superfamily N-acetyltransferase
MGSLSPRGVVVLIPKKADLPSEILPALIERYKTTRLTALQLDPSAFGSNYAREIEFTYETWLSRATNPLGKTFVSVGTSGPETLAENVRGSSNDPSIAPVLHEEWLGTITLFGPKVLANEDALSLPWTTFTRANSNNPPDLDSIEGRHALYNIFGMFVKPGQRREGRGRGLVEAALAAAVEEATAASATRVTVALEVEYQNQAALGLYRSVGFEECIFEKHWTDSQDRTLKWERQLR